MHLLMLIRIVPPLSSVARCLGELLLLVFTTVLFEAFSSGWEKRGIYAAFLTKAATSPTLYIFIMSCHVEGFFYFILNFRDFNFLYLQFLLITSLY